MFLIVQFNKFSCMLMYTIIVLPKALLSFVPCLRNKIVFVFLLPWTCTVVLPRPYASGLQLRKLFKQKIAKAKDWHVEDYSHGATDFRKGRHAHYLRRGREPWNGIDGVWNLTCISQLEVELWCKETPLACRNFLQLCMEGYYDGNIFHRIIKGFMAQTGDPTGTGSGKLSKNEI